VLTTKADTTKTEETRPGELTRIDSSGHDQDAAAAENTRSARETGTIAQEVPQRTLPQAAPPAPPSFSQNPVPDPAPVARNALPQTASRLPLVGLIGLLSLVVFSGMRLWRTNA
jgi:hypothetical protein